MALFGLGVHSINPVNTGGLQPQHKVDILGMARLECRNCRECPQFVMVPGHVLCAYCGCPPARHIKDKTSPSSPSTAHAQQHHSSRRKRGRTLSMNSSPDSVRQLLDSTVLEDSSETESQAETSSGVSSSGSTRRRRRFLKVRRWRPRWQVTAPPPRVSQLLLEEGAGAEHQLEHAWNPLDCSPNIFVKVEDPLTFHRNPVYQTTDAIRAQGWRGGQEGYRMGLHAWSVTWPQASRGTHPVVGVATKGCPLTQPGYRRLVGSNSQSWGWCLNTMKVYHDSRKFRHGVPYPRDAGDNLKVPETFIMLLDMDRGTLAFQVNNDFLGIAFSGLKGEELFPIVSAVWGHCEVTLTYINSQHLHTDNSDV